MEYNKKHTSLFSSHSVISHQRSSTESLACPYVPLTISLSGRRMNLRNRSDFFENIKCNPAAHRMNTNAKVYIQKSVFLWGGREQLSASCSPCSVTGVCLDFLSNTQEINLVGMENSYERKDNWNWRAWSPQDKEDEPHYGQISWLIEREVCCFSLCYQQMAVC